MQRTPTLRRSLHFNKVRESWGLQYSLNAKTAFPLLHSGNLLPKFHRFHRDYEGRKEFDEDHPLPVLGAKSSEFSQTHRWSHWDKFLNPQLYSSVQAMTTTPEYVGKRNGYLFPNIGWVRIGSSWKFSRNYNDSLKGYAKGTWQERNVTARWQLAPRVSAVHPDTRYAGKLEYVALPMSKLIWAFDSGRLNRNEVITLHVLKEAGVVREQDLVWPGMELVHDIEDLQYPIRVELQSATPEAIKAIENAGGSFTGSYLSIQGLYQELQPQEYPTFLDQYLPDRAGFEQKATNPKVRGFLTQWNEEEGRYASPDAGRRLSHYVRPPHDRDFPANYEEYERVKHHQKWHLGQTGTGTVLPWLSELNLESHRSETGTVADSRPATA